MKEPNTVVRKLLLTEKGTRVSETSNQYLFRVDPSANKIDVKRSVEALFKVRVTNVNTLNRKGKKKRERTMHFGSTSAWKRAIVTLQKDDSIDLT